jgi:hypothetical protein
LTRRDRYYPAHGHIAGRGPNWADILTAVGTAVLAVFAIVTTIVAGRALRAQSRQLQVELRERSREAEERRRAQAVQVYVWQTPPNTRHAIGKTSEKFVRAVLVNSSEQPVFAVQIAFMRKDSEVFWQGRVIREAPLLPGGRDEAVASIPVDEDVDDLVAVAFFRDRAGVSWATYADGRLTDLTPPTVPPPGRIRRMWRWLNKVTARPRAWVWRWLKKLTVRPMAWIGTRLRGAASWCLSALAFAARPLRRVWRTVRAR